MCSKIKQTNLNNTGIHPAVENPDRGELPEELSLSDQVESGYWGYRPGDALGLSKADDLTSVWFDINKHVTYKPLAQKILDTYPETKKILEIGCGSGSLSNHLRDINNNLTVVTLDGHQKTKESPYIDRDKHFIVLTDTDYNLVCEDNKTICFDLILSFEHFEHIHPDRFDKFLENIKKHSDTNTVVIATASKWEAGRTHCMVKHAYDWFEYLEERGFEMLDQEIINGVVPYNFEEYQTNELVFKLKG